MAITQRPNDDESHVRQALCMSDELDNASTGGAPEVVLMPVCSKQSSLPHHAHSTEDDLLMLDAEKTVSAWSRSSTNAGTNAVL
jgi:hypothetical protein